MNVKFSTRSDATPNPCKLAVTSIADPIKPRGAMLIDCANRKKIFVTLSPEEFLETKKQFDHCAKKFQSAADGLHLSEDQLNRLGELLNGVFGTGDELITLVQKVTDHNAMLRETLQTKQ